LTHKTTLGDRQAKELLLSPIALPSPLDLLFGLIPLSIVGFSLIISQPASLFQDLGDIDPLELLPVSPWFRAIEHLVSVFQVLFLPAIAILACGIYLLWWHRSIKRFKSVKPPAKQSMYSEMVRRLARKMGLKAPPQVLWTSSDRVHMPWVFWRARHILLIPKLFNAKFRRHPKELEAILCHELAHIRNGDTWKTIIAQCLSTAYFIVASCYVSLQIISAIPEWIWFGSSMKFFVNRFVPLVMSGGVLAYLNIVILREREILADSTAAYYLKNSLDLRNALVRSTLAPTSFVQPLAFASSNRAISAVSRLAKFHPGASLRNNFLYNPRLASAPRTGMVFIAGFVSILTVEAVLRSIGLNWVRQGYTPFHSATLGFLVGLWSLATFLVPLYVQGILEAKGPPGIAIATATLAYSFVWALGAALGAMVMIPALESLYPKFQSPWSVVLVYGIYAPWEITFALLFGRLAIRTLLACPPILTKSHPSILLIWVPLLIVCVPVLIWHIVSAVWFDEINTLGWRAYEFQLALGCILVYIGMILIALGVVSGVYAATYPDPQIIAKNAPTGGKQRDQNPCLQHLPEQLKDKSILFSQHKAVQDLLTRKWPIWLLLSLWILALLGVAQLHRKDLIEQNVFSKLSQIPPSQEAPDGYTRFSDSEIRASVVYPKGWFPHKFPRERYSATVEFLSPGNDQRLRLTTFPPNNTISPAEFLALGSLSLTEPGRDPNFLIKQAVSISIPTTIGYAQGYSQTVVLPSNRVSQSALLSLDWNSDGMDYSLSIECYPEDRDECSKIFAQFVSNFEYVSPALNLSTPVEDTKVYIDSQNRFAFRYPLEWKLLDVSTSEDMHIPQGAIIGLPDDQPEEWTQVMLEPDVMPSSASMIVIKFSRFSRPTNIAERMGALEISKAHSSAFREYKTLARHQFTVVGIDALQSDFDVIYVDGDRYQGSMVLFARASDLWEILVLCVLDEKPECERALSTVLDTFRFEPAIIEEGPK
jgi:Zn-dependent protease with chaperone function